MIVFVDSRLYDNEKVSTFKTSIFMYYAFLISCQCSHGTVGPTAYYYAVISSCLSVPTVHGLLLPSVCDWVPYCCKYAETSSAV